MPRDGTGVYSRPPGVDAVPDTTVESSKYNLNVADVEFDLNLARPIVAGGTGGSTPDQARGGLGAEKAAQVVVNFDAHIWFPGSFRHAATAANVGQPVIDHAFDGISYTSDAPGAAPDYIPLNQNVTVEARDLNDTLVPARKYVREKKAGVWSAWSVDQSSLFVLKAGDTMTGDLAIAKPSPKLTLDNTSVAPTLGNNSLVGKKGGENRWALELGNALEETGAPVNTGSDLAIVRFDDDGNLIDVAASIARTTGRITLNSDPVLELEAVPKRYVDTAVATIASGLAINLSIRAFITGGNTLNLELRTQDGSIPSPTKPITVAFKDPTSEGAGTGAYLPLIITAPVTMIVAAGSTLGIPNGYNARLWLGLFNVGGVPKLGVVQCYDYRGNLGITGHVRGIKDSGYAALTAEANNADLPHTWYGTAAAGASPYRVIGSLTWEGTNKIGATGIWATAPSNIDTITPNTVMPGSVVQTRMHAASGGSANVVSPTLVPGSALTIAPRSAANLIRVVYSATGAVAQGPAGTNSQYQVQLFRDLGPISGIRALHVISGGGTSVEFSGGFSFTTADHPMTQDPTAYGLYHYRPGGPSVSVSTLYVVGYAEEIQV